MKLLDVDEWLSVQVHPAAGDGRRETFGKTEMWITLAAEPDSALILGLKPGTTRADVERAGPERALLEWLRHHPVRAGDAFFVPAGQVHALGPGLTVLEVPGDQRHHLAHVRLGSHPPGGPGQTAALAGSPGMHARDRLRAQPRWLPGRQCGRGWPPAG